MINERTATREELIACLKEIRKIALGGREQAREREARPAYWKVDNSVDLFDDILELSEFTDPVQVEGS